jgi:hypothetical protein
MMKQQKKQAEHGAMRLPSDLLALVLCQLTLTEFCAAAGTCRQYHAVARKKMAWPITGPLVFDWPHVNAPAARLLSETVWAACTNVDIPTEYNANEMCQRLSKLSAELVHVSALSVVYRSNFEPRLVDAGRPLLVRLATLRTNQLALAQATSCNRLTTLVIAPGACNDDWIRWLPTLSALVCIDCEDYFCDFCPAFLFGDALAQLAHAYGTLRSIRLPSYQMAAKLVLDGLLHRRHALNISSIRVLTDAPITSNVIRNTLHSMPNLVKYSCFPHFESDLLYEKQETAAQVPRPDLQMTSLELYPDLPAIEYPWIIPYLCSVTDLAIQCLSSKEGTYPRLLRLQVLFHDAALRMQDMTCIAPCLEQLSMRELMMWEWFSGHRCPSALFASLTRLPRFQHLALRESDRYNLAEATRELILGMIYSRSWHQITSPMMPVTLCFDKDDDILSFARLSSLRWHVITGNHNKTTTYRPRVHVSRWRAWIPGLHSHQLVWERV